MDGERVRIDAGRDERRSLCGVRETLGKRGARAEHASGDGLRPVPRVLPARAAEGDAGLGEEGGLMRIHRNLCYPSWQKRHWDKAARLIRDNPRPADLQNAIALTLAYTKERAHSRGQQEQQEHDHKAFRRHFDVSWTALKEVFAEQIATETANMTDHDRCLYIVRIHEALCQRWEELEAEGRETE